MNNNSQINCAKCYYPVLPLMPKLAHAYVPYQYLSCIYSPAEGLDKGTIFPELYSPYGEELTYVYDA